MLAGSCLLAALLGGCRSRLLDGLSRDGGTSGNCGDPLGASLGRTPTTWVGIGDVDGDGHLDLMSAGGGVALAFGNGTTDFRQSTYLPLYQAQIDYVAATADWNGDGLGDLAYGRGLQPLQALLGRGDRQPTGLTGLPLLPPGPLALATGDLNRDGVADLVALSVPDPNLSKVHVLLSGRDGTFLPGATVPLAGARGSAHPGLAVTDIDGDGALDVVAVAGAGGLEILRGDGSGRGPSGLRAWTEPALPSPPSAVAAGDLDGDGRVDLVATARRPDGDNVFVLRSQGGGQFAAPIGLSAGHNPVGLAIVDWNRDQHLDLLVANSGVDHTFSILLGRGDGSFGAPLACDAVTFDALGGPLAIAAADLDADGRVDLAFAYLDGVTTVRNLGP